MREVEFRGKSKLTGNWVYGNLIIKKIKRKVETLENELYDYKYSIQHLNSKEKYTTIEVIENTIGQYTGLKDKNGKEIYEGDIVQAVFEDEEEAEIKGIVVYAEAGAYYMVIVNNGDEWDLGYLDKIEKIGNKWDNPKLLEKGE